MPQSRGTEPVGRVESIIVAWCVGIVVPVCSFFAAWWLSVGILPERSVAACAFGGLGAGVILDIFFLRRWAARAYTVDLRLLMLLYLWLSIIAYAVSMGMPVTLLAPGVAAGVYVGRRLRAAGTVGAALARGVRRAGLFTALVILCASAASGFLAMRERDMGLELRRMFDLNFEVTRPLLIAVIVGGAAAIVPAQYLLTREAAVIASGARRHGG